MTRLRLVLLLVLSSGPVYAEWVVLSPSDSAGGYSVYVDPDTIRRTGDLVTMWHLADFKTPQTVNDVSFVSLKMHAQYDCTYLRWRRLALMNFSGNMGSGEVAYTNAEEGEWTPVSSKSLGELLWLEACHKQ